MKAIKFQILGKEWTLRILKRKAYIKKNGQNSVGITHLQKRRIDLHPKGRDLETIVHELLHAYLTELCTGSTDLEDDQLEEVFAELLAKRGREMLDLADSLYEQVTNLTTGIIEDLNNEI